MSSIATVYLWDSGMVMVFDQAGEQMPDYQGPAREVAPAILRDAPPEARFHIGSWRDHLREMDRASFERMFGGAEEGADG